MFRLFGSAHRSLSNFFGYNHQHYEPIEDGLSQAEITRLYDYFKKTNGAQKFLADVTQCIQILEKAKFSKSWTYFSLIASLAALGTVIGTGTKLILEFQQDKENANVLINQLTQDWSTLPYSELQSNQTCYELTNAPINYVPISTDEDDPTFSCLRFDTYGWFGKSDMFNVIPVFCQNLIFDFCKTYVKFEEAEESKQGWIAYAIVLPAVIVAAELILLGYIQQTNKKVSNGDMEFAKIKSSDYWKIKELYLNLRMPFDKKKIWLDTINELKKFKLAAEEFILQSNRKYIFLQGAKSKNAHEFFKLINPVNESPPINVPVNMDKLEDDDGKEISESVEMQTPKKFKTSAKGIRDVAKSIFEYVDAPPYSVPKMRR